MKDAQRYGACENRHERGYKRKGGKRRKERGSGAIERFTLTPLPREVPRGDVRR